MLSVGLTPSNKKRRGRVFFWFSWAQYQYQKIRLFVQAMPRHLATRKEKRLLVSSPPSNSRQRLEGEFPEIKLVSWLPSRDLTQSSSKLFFLYRHHVSQKIMLTVESSFIVLLTINFFLINICPGNSFKGRMKLTVVMFNISVE